MTKPIPRQLPGENTIILNYQDLLDLGIPFSPQTLLRLEYDGLFPRRIRLSGSKIGWDRDEVMAWLDARRADRAKYPYKDPRSY